MRRLISGLLVLLVLLVGVDRVAAVVAGHAVARQLALAGDLERTPSVHIRGFPFVTQAVSGRYQRIDLTARELVRPTLSLSRLDVAVTGAQVPFREAIGGTVNAVPVEGLRATAVVSYAEVVRRSGLLAVTVTPTSGGVQVAGSLSVLGQTVRAATRSTVRLDRGEIVVTAQTVEVQGTSSALIDRAIAGRFDFRVDVPVLPYGLRLTGVQASSEGLALSARTEATVLQQP